MTTLTAAEIKERANVLKMLVLNGAAVFQLEATRLKFVEEYGRVLVSKATFHELMMKLLDGNYRGCLFLLHLVLFPLLSPYFYINHREGVPSDILRVPPVLF